MSGGWKKTIFGWVLGLSSWSCGAPTTTVRIIDEVDAAGGYTTRDVALSTIGDLSTLSGDVVEFFGGALLNFDQLDRARDRGQNRDLFVEHPRAVAASYVTSGGVAVATDFDTLTMFTAYAHFERAALHFGGLGVDTVAQAVPCYYEVEMASSLGELLPSADNAAFISGLDFFLLLPMVVLQDIPLGMNVGVLTHEFSHRVWYYEMWNGELFSLLSDIALLPEGPTDFNLLKSADEGVADFFAGVVSEDSGFLTASLPERYAGPRDLWAVRVVDAAWIQGEQPTVEGNYDPYPLGSVLASTLWRIKDAVGVSELEAALLAAMREEGERLRRRFQYAVGDLEREVVLQLPEANRPAICEELAKSYAVVWSRFAGVCP